MYYLFSSPLFFIFVIITIVWISKISGRVGRLEKKIEALHKGALPISEVKPVQQTTSAPSSMSEPHAITPQAIVQEIPLPISPKVEKKTEGVSGEDAGGRILGKVGIAAVFAGVAFFLKYAFDSGLIGPMARIVLGFFGGILLFGIGHFLRKNHEKYAEILMGGGIGILYLTTFAAFSFYHFITAGSAYGIMFVITALSAVVSMVNKSPVVATMGIIGGFITPLFMSRYNTDPTSLFMYILIMDLGILCTAYFYRWIHLSYIAFAGTIITVVPWAVGSSINDTTVFAFSTAFFIMFLIGSMLHHVVRREKSNEADIGLITINGVLYALLSYSVLYDSLQELFSFYLIGLALVYFIAGYFALLTNREDKALNFALPSLTVLFLTLAVPVVFDGPWITVAWFTESMILFALSRAIEGHKVHIFGFTVYVVGFMRMIAFDEVLSFANNQTSILVFNERIFLLAFAIFSTYMITYLVWRNKDIIDAESASKIVAIFMVVSQLLTVFTVTSEINLAYGREINAVSTASQKAYNDCTAKYGYSPECQRTYTDTSSLKNTENTIVSIVWALYAIALLLIGFAWRSKNFRIMGLAFLLITAFKVFVDVWSLGQLYRIVSSIAIGVIALVGSFLYSKFKDRLHQVL